MSKRSQCKQIVDYCKKHTFITAREAVQHIDCLRLAARIADLEAVGYVFDHTMVYYRNDAGEPKKYMMYKLIKEKVA